MPIYHEHNANMPQRNNLSAGTITWIITLSLANTEGLVTPMMQWSSMKCLNITSKVWYTSTGIDADASKGETSPGYFNSKLVYSYRCGTIFPWEFPEISLAYYHIFMKGPSRSIIYGQIFWHPHPHPHIASPACIYHQNQLSFAFRVSFHLTIHFENAGNICNKIDP